VESKYCYRGYEFHVWKVPAFVTNVATDESRLLSSLTFKGFRHSVHFCGFTEEDAVVFTTGSIALECNISATTTSGYANSTLNGAPDGATIQHALGVTFRFIALASEEHHHGCPVVPSIISSNGLLAVLGDFSRSYADVGDVHKSRHLYIIDTTTFNIIGSTLVPSCADVVTMSQYGDRINIQSDQRTSYGSTLFVEDICSSSGNSKGLELDLDFNCANFFPGNDDTFRPTTISDYAPCERADFIAPDCRRSVAVKRNSGPRVGLLEDHLFSIDAATGQLKSRLRYIERSYAQLHHVKFASDDIIVTVHMQPQNLVVFTWASASRKQVVYTLRAHRPACEPLLQALIATPMFSDGRIWPFYKTVERTMLENASENDYFKMFASSVVFGKDVRLLTSKGHGPFRLFYETVLLTFSRASCGSDADKHEETSHAERGNPNLLAQRLPHLPNDIVILVILAAYQKRYPPPVPVMR
jgi:hypothetical protein